MDASHPRDNVLRFGVFELDVRASELRKNGTRIKLPPQPVKVLSLLASRAGEVVLHDEVRRELWGNDTHVNVEQGLGACILRLRGALGDSATAPRYIETLPRRGYRFLVPVDGGSLSTRIMLAVLPFRNLSPGRGEDYLCEGLSEEIISEAATLNGDRLGVIARASVLRYRDVDRDVRVIGEQLGVDYVLEGSVRRQSGRARVSAQLSRASDRANVWAKTFERCASDVFGLQSEMARHIVDAVDVNLCERASTNRPRHSDPKAYEAYLKGRFFWSKRTESDVKQAIVMFRRAIALEPDYALAYSGLADANHVLGSSYTVSSVTPHDAFPEARAAALKALALDDGLAEAHASLAAVRGGYDWDWDGWRKGCLRALDLNPSYGTARQWLAESLAALGRLDEALLEIRRAQQLDPLSATIHATVAWILYFARQYESAVEQCDKTLELHPGFSEAYLYRGLALEQLGQGESALAAFKNAIELSPRSPEAVAAPGHTHALLGDRRRADAVVESLTELSVHSYVSPYLVAKIRAALGDIDEAFSAIDDAVRERSDRIAFVNVDPCLDPLRTDARFDQLLVRLGLGGGGDYSRERVGAER